MADHNITLLQIAARLLRLNTQLDARSGSTDLSALAGDYEAARKDLDAVPVEARGKEWHQLVTSCGDRKRQINELRRKTDR